MPLEKGPSGEYVATVRTAYGERKISTHKSSLTEAKRVTRMAQLDAALARRMAGEALAWKETTIAQSLKEWKRQMQTRGLSSGTIDDYLTYIKAFLRHAKVKAKDAPGSITDEMAAKWVNAGTGQKASTRKLMLNRLKIYCAFCRAKGYMACNPAEAVQKINMNKLSFEQKEAKRKVPFTDAEVDHLMGFIQSQIDVASKDLSRIDEFFHDKSYHAKRLQDRINWLKFWRVAVPISRWLGLRIGDIAGLERKSIQYDADRVVVFMDKTNVRLELPLPVQLRNVLSEIEFTHDRYVFPEQQKANASHKHRNRITTQFAELLKAAGIEGKSFHCLRGSCAVDLKARLMAAGRTEAEAVEIVRRHLGHASAETTQRHYLPEQPSAESIPA